MPELKLSKAQVVRAIETLKAKGSEVSPDTVAELLTVNKSVIYTNLEFLDSVYRYGSKPQGHDALIQQLIKEIKSYQRKVKKFEKKLLEAEINVKKSYSDGFAEGASINYESRSSDDLSNLLERKESWARGVLYLDHAEDLNEEKIKSAYRSLMQIIHPDKLGTEGNALFVMLKEAYDYLIEKYA